MRTIRASEFKAKCPDRILVATARVFGATLLTQDRRIVEAELVATL
jgi:PIN domain nuclease of toxin-antitoxin system